MKNSFRPPSINLRLAHLAAAVLAVAAVGCTSPPDTSAPDAKLADAQAPADQPVQSNNADASLAQPTILRRTLAPALYELAYSARQNAVFVASAGGTEENARLTRVLRLDPQTLALQTEIPLREQGFGMVLDDDNDRLYVGNALDAAITVIDTRTNQITNVVRLAEKVQMTGFKGETIERPPHNLRGFVLDKTNHRLFAPGLWISDSALYVLDTRTLELEKVIPGFGFGAAGVTQDEKAGKVYVSNLQGQLFGIDARTLEVESKFEIDADQLLNLAFDKHHNRVLAVDQGAGHVDVVRETVAKIPYSKRSNGNQVVAIDPSNGAIETRIDTGEGPVNLLIDEGHNRLYVTNRGAGTVTVFDTSNDYRLLHTVKLPKHPNSLALDKKTGTVFLTIKNEHQKSISDGESVARIEFPNSRL